MKIYSLQEENEKLKAAQGRRTESNGNVFDMQPTASGRRQTTQKTSAQRIPQKTVQQRIPETPAAQQRQPQGMQQRRKSGPAAARILWIVFVIFFIVMGILTND